MFFPYLPILLVALIFLIWRWGLLGQSLVPPWSFLFHTGLLSTSPAPWAGCWAVWTPNPVPVLLGSWPRGTWWDWVHQGFEVLWSNRAVFSGPAASYCPWAKLLLGCLCRTPVLVPSATANSVVSKSAGGWNRSPLCPAQLGLGACHKLPLAWLHAML